MKTCKCIEETEPQFREKIEGDLSRMKPNKAATLKYFGPDNYGISFKSGLPTLSIAFTATWEMPNGKTKDTTINMIASHCPFCGAPFESEASVGDTKEA